ncbi:glyoxalase [Vibrio sp. T187]|uniref:VOC family protein n=1 Tax=Vibrio TaxID=662 RepID=UPI0010C95728|nr:MULTISPECIES: VOC family protein [Vibrio]MBW3695826.1 glyoxalase [Vibrio sp. T187]
MRIEHIAIWTQNLELMKSFYQKYFNAQANPKYVNSAKGFSSYFLSFESGARLELMQMDTIPQSKDDLYAQFQGLIHFAFDVGSQHKVDELTNELLLQGYEVLDGPRRTGDGYYESVILDPEGNRIEITG